MLCQLSYTHQKEPLLIPLQAAWQDPDGLGQIEPVFCAEEPPCLATGAQPGKIGKILEFLMEKSHSNCM